MYASRTEAGQRLTPLLVERPKHGPPRRACDPPAW